MSTVIAENPEFSLAVQEGIATVRFRKAFLNVALDLSTRGEFLEHLDELERDPEVVGLIEINGEQFAGEDEISGLMEQLAKAKGGDMSVLHRFRRSTIQLMSRNLGFTKPVVSGVIGDITLEEFGIALMCDRVLLSPESLVKNASLGVGIPPGPILTFFLPRLVGTKRAVTLLTRTEPLEASEALDLGLADAVVSRSDLEGECRAAVQRLAELPEPVVSATRKLIFSHLDIFEEHAERAIDTMVQLLQSRHW